MTKCNPWNPPKDGKKPTYLNGRIFFKNCYLAAPRTTLGHYQEGSLTHPMLITCVLHIQPGGHQEPHNESLMHLRFARYKKKFEKNLVVVTELHQSKRYIFNCSPENFTQNLILLMWLHLLYWFLLIVKISRATEIYSTELLKFF